MICWHQINFWEWCDEGETFFGAYIDEDGLKDCCWNAYFIQLRLLMMSWYVKEKSRTLAIPFRFRNYSFVHSKITWSLRVERRVGQKVLLHLYTNPTHSLNIIMCAHFFFPFPVCQEFPTQLNLIKLIWFVILNQWKCIEKISIL